MSDTRVAIITGGSGGIGRAVTERLVADGQSVVITYGGRQGPAQQVVDEITGSGGRAAMIQADVSDEGAMTSVFDLAEREFGGVDVVVNTAGIMRLAPLAEASWADLDQMLQTNLRGTLVVNRLAATRVRSGGAIINFSSSVVKLALPTYAGYIATKSAVDGLSLVLAKELRGRDITVNSVAPGPTATPLFLDGKDQQTIDQMAKANPLERLGRPDDIAEVVSFLAGPGRWVNGQNLYANGGAI